MALLLVEASLVLCERFPREPDALSLVLLLVLRRAEREAVDATVVGERSLGANASEVGA